jgi:hypothetical protein
MSRLFQFVIITRKKILQCPSLGTIIIHIITAVYTYHTIDYVDVSGQ